MSTHAWITVSNSCHWCATCGALWTSTDFVQIGGIGSKHEPPCAGWIWHDVSERVERPTVVAAVRWHSNEDVDAGEVSITVNNRYELFRVKAMEIRDDALYFPTRLALLPGMHASFERPSSGRLKWLVREIGPAEALDYLQVSRADYLRETRDKFFGRKS